MWARIYSIHRSRTDIADIIIRIFILFGVPSKTSENSCVSIQILGLEKWEASLTKAKRNLDILEVEK